MEFVDEYKKFVNARRIKAGATETGSSSERNELRAAFSRNVRTLRKAAGLTQRALAAAAEITQKKVWQIETAAPNVTLDTVTNIARHLDVSVYELLRARKVNQRLGNCPF